MYVIKRLSDGKYVARSGSEHSYTSNLQHAQVYMTLEEARRNVCGNETIVPVIGELR